MLSDAKHLSFFEAIYQKQILRYAQNDKLFVQHLYCYAIRSIHRLELREVIRLQNIVTFSCCAGILPAPKNAARDGGVKLQQPGQSKAAGSIHNTQRKANE